jgi:UDPglucose 6-dehydrogenase/GDP-mannose 6-dehydrogenase
VKVAIIGTGYVGLVTGVGLASVGHSVTCFDMRESVVTSLTAGIPPIFEEGLEDLLTRLLETGSISFSLPDSDRLAEADIIMIAVGTPSKDGDIDLSQIRSAAELAGRAVKAADHPIAIIVKSTVVPGTTSGLVLETIAASGADRASFGIGMNPEFLREGTALVDFTTPDRIVIGFEDGLARDRLRELYADFPCPKLEVNTKTAELTKYANNMYLALQISAANEIANVAARVGGIDPLDVVEGVLSDHRWSGGHGAAGAHPIAKYLIPGPGFGGSCFPKDVEAFREFGKTLDLPMRMSSAILDVNGAQPGFSLDSMTDGLPSLDGQRVLVLGLSFKPQTDDVRETPALGMIRALRVAGATVLAHDPLAMDAYAGVDGGETEFVVDWQAVVPTVDAVLVVTPWADYRGIAGLLTSGQVLLDPRRSVDPESLSADVVYRSIGVQQ